MLLTRDMIVDENRNSDLSVGGSVEDSPGDWRGLIG